LPGERQPVLFEVSAADRRSRRAASKEPRVDQPQPLPDSKTSAAGPTTARQPRNAVRWMMVVLCVAGAIVSHELWKVGRGGIQHSPLLAQACGGADGGDCMSVLRSSWAGVPLTNSPSGPRVPLAAVGVGYFVAVGLWCLLVGPPTKSRRLAHLPLIILVTLGLLQSLSSMSVMAFELHRWCMGCVAVHIVNGLLALLTLASFPWSAESRAIADHPSGRLALAGAIAAGCAFLLPPAVALISQVNSNAALLGQRYRELVEDPTYARWNYDRQPVVNLDAVAADRFIGPADARHSVVAFTDLQCERCRDLHAIVSRIAAENPSVLRVAWLNYPLNAECNPHARGTTHPMACDAARAVEAAAIADGPEAAEKLRAALLERQSSLRAATIDAAAESLGLRKPRFDELRRGPETAERVAADAALAKSVGASVTPAVFLNGRELKSWTSEPTWRAVLGLAPAAGAASRKAATEADSPAGGP